MDIDTIPERKKRRRSTAADRALDELFLSTTDAERVAVGSNQHFLDYKKQDNNGPTIVDAAKKVGTAGLNLLQVPSQIFASTLHGAKEAVDGDVTGGLFDASTAGLRALGTYVRSGGQESVPEGDKSLTDMGAEGVQSISDEFDRPLPSDEGSPEYISQKAHQERGHEIAGYVGTGLGIAADPLGMLDVGALPDLLAVAERTAAGRKAAQVLRAAEEVVKGGAKLSPEAQKAAQAALREVRGYADAERASAASAGLADDVIGRSQGRTPGGGYHEATLDEMDAITRENKGASVQGARADARIDDANRLADREADAAVEGAKARADEAMRGATRAVPEKGRSAVGSKGVWRSKGGDFPATVVGEEVFEGKKYYRVAEGGSYIPAEEFVDSGVRNPNWKNLGGDLSDALADADSRLAAEEEAAWLEHAERAGKDPALKHYPTPPKPSAPSVWDDLLGPAPERPAMPDPLASVPDDIDVLPASPEPVTHIGPPDPVAPPKKALSTAEKRAALSSVADSPEGKAAWMDKNKFKDADVERAFSEPRNQPYLKKVLDPIDLPALPKAPKAPKVKKAPALPVEAVASVPTDSAAYAPVGGVEEVPRGSETLEQATSPASSVTHGKIRNTKELSRFLAQVTNTAVTEHGIGAGSLGSYGLFSGEVAAKEPGVIFHEIAHRLEDLVFQGGAKDLLTGTAFKPWAHELDALASHLSVGKRSSATSEGFAEGVRLWLSDPTDLANRAPKFMRDFHGVIHAKDPKLAANMVSLQRQIMRFESASAASQVISHIVSHGGPFAPTNMNAAEKIGWAVVDDLIPLRKAEAQIYGPHADTAQMPSAYIEMARHSPAQAETFLFGGGGLGFTAPSLHEVAVAAGDNDALAAYVYASRVLQKHDAAISAGKEFALPTSIFTTTKPMASSADAQAFALRKLREVIAQTDPKVIDAAQNQLKAHSNAIPDWLNEHGLISSDMAKKWKANNPIYLPMNRKGMGAPSMSAKAELESTKEILDPMAQMAAHESGLAVSKARNDVGISLLRMANENKDIAHLVSIVPGQVERFREIERVTEAAKAAGMTVDDYVAASGLSQDDLQEVMGVLSQEFSGQAERGQFRVKNYANSKGIRPYKNLDIDEIVIEVKDPNIAQVIHNLNNDRFSDAISKELSLLAMPARAFRYGTTGNLAFGVKNFASDILTSAINSRAQRIPLFDAFYNAFSGLKSVINKDEFYQIARDSGSFIEGLPEGNVARVKTRLIGDAINPKDKAVMDSLFWGVMEDYSSNLERATRTGEVKALIKQRKWDPKRLAPWQMAQLGQAGRQVTTDFLISGAKMKLLNALSPFANANVQGIYGFGKGVARRPGHVAVQAATAGAGASALLWYINRNENWYKDLSQEQRDRWYHLRVGDRTLRFPRPQGPAALFGQFTEKLLDKLSNARPWATNEAVASALGVIDGTLPLVSYPPFKFAAEAMSGSEVSLSRLLSGQRAQSIVPAALQKGSAHEQEYPDQGATSRLVAGGLSKLGMEMSPIAIERHAGTLGGTLARGVMSTSDSLIESLFGGGGKPSSSDWLRDRPVVGRFIERDNPSRTDAGDAMHKTYTSGRIAEESANKRSGDDRNEFLREHKEEILRGRMAHEAVKTDAEMSKAIMAIRENTSLSPAEKRDKINVILTRKAELMRRAAERVFSTGE